ncbi:MAG: ATP-binding protein [Nitrososphaeria archaeon]|nr:ATP-binding protein [Conexivisphaerales archaeon]
MEKLKVFDDINGKFEARLRDQRERITSTRGREGEITVSSQVALLEVKFDDEVFEKLQEPQFVAVEKKGNQYLIYEIASIKPLHYQMVGMDERIPRDIRWEMMESVHESWKESNETWINVWAVPTKYRMTVYDENIEFVKDNSIPLPGSRVYLLSRESVERFLSIEDGIAIGKLLGFELDLKVNLNSMVKYHMGAFGFTGSGKSNLLSYLIRKSLEADKELKAIVFDIAGEYGIHLLDELIKEGEMFSTEKLDSADAFLDSQVLPDTLEEKVSLEELKIHINAFLKNKSVKLVSTLKPPTTTLRQLYEMLQQELKAGTGRRELERLLELITSKGYTEETDVTALKDEDKAELINILESLMNYVSEKSNVYKSMQSLSEYLNSSEAQNKKETIAVNPEDLADYVLKDNSKRLTVVYVPEPEKARAIASAFIDRLLYLKKTTGSRKKILVVLDEAQEFIPDKTSRDDYSDISNRSVEALLRQGRKYRAHCWLSTQRLAHLNTNAVQQLHSYFVSTLPRLYDRLVIADAFSLNTDIIERTTELETGQWLFVSYRATRQKNVPVFIQAPNNEEILIENLKKMNS